jgi:dTDP-4-dehydrorhamnose reductase
VLLLGATGQVGAELARQFRDADLTVPDRKAADLSRPDSLRAVVRGARPSVILNAAAYTAVDRAEGEPELADRVNHLAPGVLAEEAERARALLVHYSTDYVFDGSKAEPWVETDQPAPLNVYGASKLAGERAIAEACSRHTILRTSWVYAPRGHNFLQTMLRLGRERDLLRVVDDQWGAPTTAAALAEATRAVVERICDGQTGAAESWAGVYHASCGGQTSWCGFAQAIFSQAAKQEARTWPTVMGIASVDYPTPARRPRNSALSNGKLAERFGVHLPSWQRGLQDALEQMYGAT